MKNTYLTSEVAKMMEVHPNTIRLYEDLHLISKAERKQNGYRIFTQLHVEQLKVARLAFEIEVLQNGLRKRAVEIVKTTATCDFRRAMELTALYLQQLKVEQCNAKKAIEIVEEIMLGKEAWTKEKYMTRKETAEHLHITMDTLRNWERNGLLDIKRKQNGYRVYTNNDIQRLIIIKSLRCANYSLSAILRMLSMLKRDPEVNIGEVLDKPNLEDDIITACDNLLTSLKRAEGNAKEIGQRLKEMMKKYNNPPL